MKQKKVLKKIINIIFIILIVYLVIPLPEPLFENDFSTVVIDDNREILRAFLNKKQQWHFPPEYKNVLIPGKLRKAVLCFEDKYFYSHPGVNPISILRALFQNISTGKRISGASTITMQVVRLATKNKRTIWNKFVEILQSLKLETKYSKEKILKMYISHAPYGGNIIGYQAASRRYFHKKPDQLTWSEAATLAVLPNSPGLISLTSNRNKLIEKRNKLLETLLKRKVITEETFSLSIQEPLLKKEKSFFNQAPHLARALKNRAGLNNGYIHTSILKPMQIRTEELVKQHLNYLNTLGIKNGAAMVVETKTGRIRAYIGSQDFLDRKNSGQVNGVRAPRSTGSILKPFLYALAIDEGLILPQTLIKDIPSYFGPFSPANADKKYQGLVSSKQALIRSLNVPAARILNTYGLNKFYLFLKSAHITTLFRNPDEYGLTLILGGAEATLYDLVTLYIGLGNYGKFQPLKIIRDKPKKLPVKTWQLISPESCYLTLNMLKEVKRPGAEYYWEQFQNQFPIAWKTGTSYGQRDAWSIGVTPQWAIAVWVGNFSGEGNSNLSGASCAAPLMFDIFNLLPKNPAHNWFSKSHLNLRPAKLCMDTGYTASEDCQRTYWAEAPSGTRALKRCPYHKTIYVSRDEKFRVCSLCWKPGEYKKIKKLIYTPDVSQYLREKGLILSAIPPHKKNCSGNRESKPMQIIYPVPYAKIWIPRDFYNHGQKITLKAAHRHQNSKIYWYLDNVYQGTTQDKHKLVLSPKTGIHELEIIDEEGHRDHRKFYVYSIQNQPVKKK